MIKRILLPIDYSEASLNALETAINIAAGNNALLQILHVNNTMPGAEESYSKERANEISDAMAINISIRHGIKVKIIFADGIVGHSIINAVFENKTDLIIMGSHGVSGARDLFIGSNSYYVIKRAACPVLLIPEGRKWIEFENILFPVRPTVFSLKHYQLINDIVMRNKNKCNLQIFCISADTYEKDILRLSSMMHEVKNKKNDGKIDTTFSFSSNKNIAESVLAMADHIKADVIIISPGIDVATRPFFVGPFSQKIINHSKIPILSLLRTFDT